MERKGKYLKNALLAAGLGTALIATVPNFGCHNNTEPEPTPTPFPTPTSANYGQCLNPDKDLYYNTGTFAGINNFVIGMSDPYWLKFSGCPDSKIWNGHAGGYGDTYQTADAHNKVLLICAYNQLNTIVLSKDWKGQILGSGIKIGDTLEYFVEKYPGAQILPNGAEHYAFISMKGHYMYRPDAYITLAVDSDLTSNIIKRIRMMYAGMTKPTNADCGWGCDF